MKKSIFSVLTINALVKDEATKLKKFATSDELNRLDFKKLRTEMRDNCIYGQMTGDCFNDRAGELIMKSCKKVFVDKCHEDDFDDKRMGEMKGKLNGKLKSIEERSGHWSPIEIFIDMPRNKENGNNERLVAYLKGETEDLKLK